MFFFEKKNQKTSATLDGCCGNARAPTSKSFLLLFFKKEGFLKPMQHFLYPALFALFVWWFSTGAIIFLDQLPRRTFKYSMAGATVVLGASFWGMAASAHDTSLAGAYCGFSCGLLAWGWQEISFYMGFVTGPAHGALPRGLLRLEAFHPRHPDQPVARTGHHRLRSGGHGDHLEPAQPRGSVDLHGAVVDAPERQAERVPRRAEPQRGIPCRTIWPS